MKMYVKVALGVVMVIAISGILAALYIYNRKPVDTSKAKPDFTLTSFALHSEFVKDETGATARYAGKIIEVSGKIAAVRNDVNSTTISLETDDISSSVLCDLTSAVDDSTLVIGENIVIRGECSGFLMDVLMKNCSIIK